MNKKFEEKISETRKRNERTIKKIVDDYEAKAYAELKYHLERNPFMAEVDVLAVPIKYFDLVNGTVEIGDISVLPIETVKGDMDSADDFYENFCNIQKKPDENKKIALLLYEAFKEAGFKTVISLFEKPYYFYPLIAEAEIIEEIFPASEEDEKEDEKTT